MLETNAIKGIKKDANLLQDEYIGNQPYPHLVFENFFDEKRAHSILSEFPRKDQGSWTNYNHINEKKLGKSKLDELPPTIRAAFSELLSEEFSAWLSKLTGIPNLIPDPWLDGGGLHQTERGGFLNVHTDFNKHHKNPTWRRRVNLLVYFNDEWKQEWGGELELWDREMKECRKKVAPAFNRALIFTTDESSFHGYPDPITCPEGITRKSFALYYFTEEGSDDFRARSTIYKATPKDGVVRRGLIWADMQALKAYSYVKRRFGLSDDFASKLLARFFKSK